MCRRASLLLKTAVTLNQSLRYNCCGYSVCLCLCVKGGSLLCLWHNSRQVLVASVTWHTASRRRVGSWLRCSAECPASPHQPASCRRYLSPLLPFYLYQPPRPSHQQFPVATTNPPPTVRSRAAENKGKIMHGGLPDAGWELPSPPLLLLLSSSPLQHSCLGSGEI